jgi:hypothetical protein
LEADIDQNDFGGTKAVFFRDAKTKTKDKMRDTRYRSNIGL